VRSWREFRVAILLASSAIASADGCVLDYEVLRPDSGIDVADDGRMPFDAIDSPDGGCGHFGESCCDALRCGPALA
jgi:hypothetical protein